MQSFILKAFSGLQTQRIHLFDGFKPLCILLGGSVASRIPRRAVFSRFFRASQSQMISKNQVGRMSQEPSDVRALEFIRFETVHIQNQMLFRDGRKSPIMTSDSNSETTKYLGKIYEMVMVIVTFT